ncbi:MAG: ABC transporter [Chloroflexi bacterium]|mgnify:CR=1 FL=1|nr:MAG: ABC transporter [Chloroflexota bacterium]RLC92507.1 MAG: ABC transporter [Chloroflexota bacterium]HEY66832.1 ABC transporter ATP-binding protein [Thermoflexia bacterium]
MSNDEVIHLEDVWVRYDEQVVLEEVNLSVEAHDFLGIIGPNGGGKTTLLKVILGLVKPSRGKVTVLGGSPEESRRFVGYVPQYTRFDREFPVSVWDVALMGRLGQRGRFRKYTAEDKRIAAEALERVEMLDLKGRQIGKLSGGQIQRVLIARALATEPTILLLDEPTASLDTQIEVDLYELLRRLNEEVTIILVSHDIGVISAYVKKIACLNRRLIYHASKEITPDMLEEAYRCPVDLIAHGVPHRVLATHQ